MGAVPLVQGKRFALLKLDRTDDAEDVRIQCIVYHPDKEKSCNGDIDQALGRQS